MPLAEHFLSGMGKRLAPEAAARLASHDWPGNVRELRNAVERAALQAHGAVIEEEAFGFLTPQPDSGEGLDWPDEDLPSAIERLERLLIGRALAKNRGNRAEAARALGIHRQLLYAKIKRFGLDVSGERTEGVGKPDAPLK